MNEDMSHSIDVCNSLLRRERAAVETYETAIDKYSDHSIVNDLDRIREEHLLAIARLEDHVTSMGGTPDADSGAWGAIANTVQSAANLFGAESAIGALQRGEEQSRDDYYDALEDDDVTTSCKEMMRTDLLPRAEEHISALERLEHAA